MEALVIVGITRAKDLAKEHGRHFRSFRNP